jgi:hypothetical protein
MAREQRRALRDLQGDVGAAAALSLQLLAGGMTGHWSPPE